MWLELDVLYHIYKEQDKLLFNDMWRDEFTR